MALDGLRKMAGVEATATNVVIGRSSTGAGELEEIPCTAVGRALLAASTAAAQRSALGLAPVSLTGDYSDGTVLAALVAILVGQGLITDATTP